MTATYFIDRDRCPVCEGARSIERFACAFEQPPISRYLVDFYSRQGRVEFEYLHGARYRLLECGDCGALYQHSVPNDELMQRLYELWIDAGDAQARQGDEDGLDLYARHAQDVMQIVAWRAGARSGLRVLDHGMGWGKWALAAKAFGCDVSGTELSPTRVAYARSNGIRVLDWDALPGQRFDFVNTEQVFEHLPDPLGALRHLRESLVPGGVIKISVPNAHDIDRRLKRMDWTAPAESRDSLNAVAPLEHINCFRRRSFTLMAERAGMEEVEMPLSVQYGYMTQWNRLATVARNLLRPVSRNMLKRQNCVFLRRPA